MFKGETRSALCGLSQGFKVKYIPESAVYYNPFSTGQKQNSAAVDGYLMVFCRNMGLGSGMCARREKLKVVIDKALILT